MKVSVVTKSEPWKALRKALEQAKRNAASGGMFVDVGVMGETKHEEEGPRTQKEAAAVRNVELAVIHEYGTKDGHIPARPFILSTFNAKRPEYVAMLKKLVKGIYLLKMTPTRALGLLGSKMASDMKKRIRAGIPPPNAPDTVAHKGSSKPLVDSGQLLSSITWAVGGKPEAAPAPSHEEGGHHE